MLAKIRFSSSFSSTGSSAAEGTRHKVTMEMRVWIKYLAIYLLPRPWHTYPSHLGQRLHGATMFGANCGVVLLFPKKYKRGDICRWDIKSKRISYNDVILPQSESVSEARWDRQNYHHQTSHWKSEAQEGGWEKRVRHVNRKKDTGIRTDKTVVSQITCQVTRRKPQACFSNRTNALSPLAALCDTQPHTNMVTFKSFHVYQLPSGLTVGLQVRFSLLRSLYLTHTHLNKARFLTEARCRWIKLHGSLLFLSCGHGSSSVPHPKQMHIYHCYVVVIFRGLFDICCSLCLTLERTGLSFS